MRSVPLFVCAARQQFLGLQGQERGGLTPRPLEKWPHPEQGRLWSAWRAASLEGKFKGNDNKNKSAHLLDGVGRQTGKPTWNSRDARTEADPCSLPGCGKYMLTFMAYLGSQTFHPCPQSHWPRYHDLPSAPPAACPSLPLPPADAALAGTTTNQNRCKKQCLQQAILSLRKCIEEI